jgi:hypothetical protein
MKPEIYTGGLVFSSKYAQPIVSRKKIRLVNRIEDGSEGGGPAMLPYQANVRNATGNQNRAKEARLLARVTLR